ncbi:hypothetical protein Ddc_23905 [Ditylenchus destructor]|nr:hypothetical protein Ddc_23905 [Ditylenchus destructor]
MPVQRQGLGHVQRVGEHQPLFCARRCAACRNGRAPSRPTRPAHRCRGADRRRAWRSTDRNRPGRRPSRSRRSTRCPGRRGTPAPSPPAPPSGGRAGARRWPGRSAGTRAPWCRWAPAPAPWPAARWRGPRKVPGSSSRSVRSTSGCHSPEKRRRRPKSKNWKGWRRGASSRGKNAQGLDLFRQTATPLGDRGAVVEATEVQLVDHRQNEDLEAHHVDLRPAHDDGQLVAVGGDMDEIALEAEDAQQVDEVRPHEAQRAQVVELVLAEGQGAQVVQLALQVRDQLGERVLRRVAAGEAVLGLRLRMAMQHRLPHGEL